MVYKKYLIKILCVIPLSQSMRGWGVSSLLGLGPKSLSVRGGVTFYGSGSFSIGHRVMFNRECFLDYSGQLEIGSDVALGMRVMILTSTHAMGCKIRCGNVKRKKTIIGDGVWICAGAIVLPGVKIGDSSVIGAGEVVDTDVPPNSIFLKGRACEIK